MIRSFYRTRNNKVQTDLKHEDLRRALRNPHGLLWVDLEAPTSEEVAVLDEVFAFHPLTIEDCLHASELPKMDDYGKYLFVVLLAPDAVRPGQEELDLTELDIYLGRNYVVTFHKRPARSVTALAERAQRQPRDVFGRGSGFFFHSVFDRIVDQYLNVIANWDRAVDQYEPRIIEESPDHEILQEIIDWKRGLLDMRQTVVDHRQVTDHLIRTPSPLIAGDVEMYLSDVRDHLERTLDEIDLCRDTINSARELYLSIISNRTNEVMRVLAVVSTIVLPLTLIASIYGMNVGLPGGGEPSRGYGESFWVILMVMAGLALLMVGIFRHKKWL